MIRIDGDEFTQVGHQRGRDHRRLLVPGSAVHYPMAHRVNRFEMTDAKPLNGRAERRAVIENRATFVEERYPLSVGNPYVAFGRAYPIHVDRELPNVVSLHVEQRELQAGRSGVDGK